MNAVGDGEHVRDDGVGGCPSGFSSLVLASKKTPVRERLHGQGGEIGVCNFGKNFANEAGGGSGIHWIDRKLGGEKRRSCVPGLFQHPQKRCGAGVAGKSDVTNLAFVAGLDGGFQHTGLEALVHIMRR